MTTQNIEVGMELPRKEFATGFIDFNKFSDEFKQKVIKVPLTETERNKSYFYRGSSEYIAWRDAVRTRDKFTCQRCGSKKRIVAHHIFGFMDYPYVRYDLENGISLCQECHKIVHREISEAEKERKYNLKLDKRYVLCAIKIKLSKREIISTEEYVNYPTDFEINRIIERFGADTAMVFEEYSQTEIPFFE